MQDQPPQPSKDQPPEPPVPRPADAASQPPPASFKEPQRSVSPGSGSGKTRIDQGIPLSKLSTLGLELGGTVAVLSVLGWWLDGQWGTSPWLMLTGVVIATIGVTYKMLRISAAADKKRDKK